MGSPTVYKVYMIRYIVGFCVVITIYVRGREVECPTVYEGYMVRYIVGFQVSYNNFNNYGYCVFMIICTT